MNIGGEDRGNSAKSPETSWACGLQSQQPETGRSLFEASLATRGKKKKKKPYLEKQNKEKTSQSQVNSPPPGNGRFITFLAE